MTELLTLVPSRQRPDAVRELADAFNDTCSADTKLVFAVDEDDPEIQAYAEAAATSTREIGLWVNHGTKTMVAALNGAAHDLLPVVKPFAVAFMGDDHRPRTHGWDAAYLETLRTIGTGIVYGNDLIQGDRIPTQVAMTADIPAALGHMAPPSLTHLFVDNYWRDLGIYSFCLTYLPEVVVEHVHPYAGKVEWDEGHRRVNAPQMYALDSAAYGAYVRDALADDVLKVQALRGGRR